MDLTEQGRAPPESRVNLRQTVERYLALGGGYGRPVALAGFGLTKAETEGLFSGFDEDYHISRYFQFSDAEGQAFAINGFLHTHVAIGEEIRRIL